MIEDLRFWGLFNYAIDGLIDFSQAPLSIASWFGMFMTFIAFIALGCVFVRRIVWGNPVAGWASTICVIVFIGGTQLMCLAIMGQYIAKTYIETKHRSHFIVKESNIETINKLNRYR